MAKSFARQTHNNFSLLVSLSLLRIKMTVSECSVNANLGVGVDQLDVVVKHVQGGLHLAGGISSKEERDKFSPQPFPSCPPASASAPPSIAQIVTF